MSVNNPVCIRNTNQLYVYSQMDWRVRPLVVAVKAWAKAQGINEARNLTMSSYLLSLMVIHFLQCGVEGPPVLPSLQVLHPSLQKVDNHQGEEIAGYGQVAGLVDALGFDPGLDGHHQRPHSPVHLAVHVQQVRVPNAHRVVHAHVNLAFTEKKTSLA